MTRLSARKRPGFSLLEMVLALAIGLLLLAALYQTLNTQVQFARIGRDAISEADVARSVMMRINDDIVNQLGILDPRTLPTYEVPEATTAEDTTAQGTTTPSTTTPSTMTTMSTTQSNIVYNVIRGDSNRLTVAVYRVQPASASGEEVVSDLRRVSYWLINNGDRSLGLARHETKLATAAEIDSAPSDLPEQNKKIIAKEVKDILFEYFDGTAWQTSWEGTTLGGTNGDIPVGPPAAIAVTITFRANPNNASADPTAPEAGTTYKQVIAIPAANNFPGTQASP